MKTRIVITGMGCLSPLGHNVQQSWEAAVAGKSGAGPITLFDASEHETRIAAEVKGFDAAERLGRKEARRMDRYTQFAVAATQEALSHAGIAVNEGNRQRIGVFIGTGIGGIGTIMAEADVYRARGPRRVSPFLVPMMLPDAAGGQVAITFGMRGPNLSIVSACATGTNAIGEAAEVIRRGSADVMVAGGAEAAVVPVALAGFNSMGAISTRNDQPERAAALR
jgi:3-oxoacyl-[acyl-carrier-protein] synthase II